MVATLVLITLGTVILSLIVTTLFMLGMNVPWWDVGTKLAIICPLVATPPIMYIFLTLIEKLNAVNSELETALSEVKELSELLPMCAWCRKIRDGEGYWSQLESYLIKHTNSSVTHSICPECAEGLRKDAEVSGDV
jgi:hypothetical protein